jgi:hypothetical protein
MAALPTAARWFIGGTLALAAIVLAVAATSGVVLSVAVPLAVVVLVTERFLRALSGPSIDIVVTTPVIMGSFAIGGPSTAAFVAAATLLTPGTAAPIKRAFNAATYVVAAFAGGSVYVLVGGDAPLGPASFPGSLAAFVVAAVAYEAVNAILILAVVSLTERLSPATVWRGAMAEAAVPILVYSLFGLLLAVVWTEVGWLSAVLVLLPLVVARWVFAQFAAQREAYEATIRSLIQAVETKDAYTRGHSERVARASMMIGRRIGMRDERLRSLRYAGTLHDVGKLGVPTRVLQKAGRLTDDEFAAIQMHPVRGREITRELDFLSEAVEGIYHHHERMDGRGYPLGLTGDQIPEFARVIAVADAFDSMTTTRSYRGARSVAEAVEELIRCRDTQFDSGMVDALVAAVSEEGWRTPGGPPPLVDAEPSLGRDDDDPTAAEALAAHRPAAAQPRPPGGRR